MSLMLNLVQKVSVGMAIFNTHSWRAGLLTSQRPIRAQWDARGGGTAAEPGEIKPYQEKTARFLSRATGNVSKIT